MSAYDAEDIRLALPDLADKLHAQLSELHVRPRADAAEILAAAMGMAQRTLLTYAGVLKQDCERVSTRETRVDASSPQDAQSFHLAMSGEGDGQ